MSQQAPALERPRFKSAFERNVVAATLMLATVMQTLDSTIANVALPRVQGVLSATQDEMGWVLTSYIIASAITIPLAGWLASEFGRRRVFLTSVVLFTIASVLCGLAQTLPQLVLFRFLQGMGGAALLPLSQAVLFDINEPKNFARAMAVWASAANMGPILGAILGGWLTEDYSWRWVFFINLPIGLITFLGLYLTLPESRYRQQGSGFDLFGFAALSLAVGSLQLMLDRGQLLDWFASPEIDTYAVVCGLSLYLFIVHILSYDRPFLKLGLFKDRNFLASTVFAFVIGVVLFASMALFPPLLQTQLGYPVILTGWVTSPRGLGMLAPMLVVGKLLTRVDGRAVMALGLSLMAFSAWQMTHYSLLMGLWPVIAASFIQGMGIGLTYIPMTAIAFATLPQNLRNEGTAFFNLIRYLGSSTGISVMIFLLAQNTQKLHAALGAHVTPYLALYGQALAAAHLEARDLPGLAALNAAITRQAMMMGYIDDFKLMMMMTLLAIPLLLLISSAKREVQGVGGVE